MKAIFKPGIILLFLMGMTSCGMLGKKEMPEDEEMASKDISESDEADDGDFALEKSLDEESTDDEMSAVDEEEAMDDEGESPLASSPAPTPPSRDRAEDSVGVGTYTLKKGETLMQMAFKIYGDYRSWKEIKRFNNLDSTNISGMKKIRYRIPAQKFVWNPGGHPYLIKQGDTLVIISQKKYDTTEKWRHLYEHNRPLIQDPNLIFAGFTIYYIPKREMASEQ